MKLNFKIFKNQCVVQELNCKVYQYFIADKEIEI